MAFPQFAGGRPPSASNFRLCGRFPTAPPKLLSGSCPRARGSQSLPPPQQSSLVRGIPRQHGALFAFQKETSGAMREIFFGPSPSTSARSSNDEHGRNWIILPAMTSPTTGRPINSSLEAVFMFTFPLPLPFVRGFESGSTGPRGAYRWQLHCSPSYCKLCFR